MTIVDYRERNRAELDAMPVDPDPEVRLEAGVVFNFQALDLSASAEEDEVGVRPRDGGAVALAVSARAARLKI